jgi:hypothetical protein
MPVVLSRHHLVIVHVHLYPLLNPTDADGLSYFLGAYSSFELWYRIYIQPLRACPIAVSFMFYELLDLYEGEIVEKSNF